MLVFYLCSIHFLRDDQDDTKLLLIAGLLSRMSLDKYGRRTLTYIGLESSGKDYAGISKGEFIAITIAGIGAQWLYSGLPSDCVVLKFFLLSHDAQDCANGNFFALQARARELNDHNEILPDVDYTGHMDNPEAFNKTLIGFLKSNQILRNTVCSMRNSDMQIYPFAEDR
jgi:hypothetical protein